MTFPPKRLFAWVVPVLFVSGIALPSYAEEPASPPSPRPPPPASAGPGFGSSPTWGWILVGSSVALGAAMTASGLAVECQGERQCRIDTSLLVSGGLGVASIGSMFGFVILERAADSNEPNAFVLTARGQF